MPINEETEIGTILYLVKSECFECKINVVEILRPILPLMFACGIDICLERSNDSLLKVAQKSKRTDKLESVIKELNEYLFPPL